MDKTKKIRVTIDIDIDVLIDDLRWLKSPILDENNASWFIHDMIKEQNPQMNIKFYDPINNRQIANHEFKDGKALYGNGDAIFG